MNLQIVRILFLVFHAIHIAAFWPFAGEDGYASLWPSGLAVLISYGLLLAAELKGNPWRSTPLLIYLAGSMVRVGVVAIFLSAVAANNLETSIRFASYDPRPYIGRGHLLLLTGEWIFLASYFAVERLLRGDAARRPLGEPLKLEGALILGIGMSLVAWGLRGLTVLGVDLAVLGQAAGMFIQFGPPTAMLILLFAGRGQRGPDKLLPWAWAAVILAVEMAFALRSYMKEDTIRTLLPLGIYFAESLGRGRGGQKIRWRRIVPLGLLAYFVLLVLVPYNAILRHSTMRKTEFGITDNILAVLEAAVPGTEGFNEIHRFPDRGLWGGIRRNDYASCAAWVVDQVENQGTVHGETLADGLIAIIPRVVWPEKPLIAPGRTISVRLGMGRTFETAESSTGLGLAGTLWYNGAAPALILGMALNAAVLCLTWHVVRPFLLGNPFATIIYMILALASVHGFSGEFDAGLSRYAYIWIVFVPLMFLGNVLFPAESATALRNAALRPPVRA